MFALSFKLNKNKIVCLYKQFLTLVYAVFWFNAVL
jgi:hypothetical protein